MWNEPVAHLRILEGEGETSCAREDVPISRGATKFLFRIDFPFIFSPIQRSFKSCNRCAYARYLMHTVTASSPDYIAYGKSNNGKLEGCALKREKLYLDEAAPGRKIAY